MAVVTPRVQKALAPTGKLRVGLYLVGPRLGNPLSVILDPSSGEITGGVGFELAKELARRMGIALEPIVYPSILDLVVAMKAAQWDISFLTVSATRSTEMDFTTPHIEIERGYLVPLHSSISALADVDRRGVRVTMPGKGGSYVFLSRLFKNAVLVPADDDAGALQLIRSGQADAFAANKPTLFEMSSELHGYRVLDGSFASDIVAMAIPKGRSLGLSYASRFIEDVKAEGLVKAAIEKAGIRGAVVAPPSAILGP